MYCLPIMTSASTVIDAAPYTDVPRNQFLKVAKISHFLATFLVHPWTFLTFHEPMPTTIDWL